MYFSKMSLVRRSLRKKKKVFSKKKNVFSKKRSFVIRSSREKKNVAKFPRMIMIIYIIVIFLFEDPRERGRI